MKTTPKKILQALILCLISVIGHSQLTTNNTLTPQQLVNNILIGGGVSASNIVYTGDPLAIGSFDGTNCNVGLNSGVILTTGTILASGGVGFLEGPHGPNDQGSAGIDNNTPGDPLLAALAGNPSFNAARLEFDFVPQSDSIKFNFVFASEEYLEFVNSGVNDAFGFFISGNNPAGGTYANENIALIPGTTIPVTIDNLNSTLNSIYYIDNGDGFTAPQNTSNTYIQYDGFTSNLTAKAAVICGQTYHIIIVISDIGDGVYDSGVFLEEGSFSSPGISISTDLSFQGNTPNDSTLLEGCSSASLWFTRTDSLAFAQTIPITISGTATNGLDYSGIPSFITFPAGEDSVNIIVSALFDNLPEGTESIQINITVPSNCANVIQDSLILYIQNVDPLNVDLGGNTVQCPNQNVILSATISGGAPGYSYLWSTGETTSSIQVTPTTTTSYSVIVTDTCGQVDSDTIIVSIIVPTPLAITAFSDTTVFCPNETIQLSAIATNGYGGYTFLWSNGATLQQIQATVPSTTLFSVVVTDQCGFTASDSVTVTVMQSPLYVNAGPDVFICKNEVTTLSASATAGTGGNYSYLWSTGQSTSSISVNPLNTTTYIVSAADGCGVYSAWDTITVHILTVNADFYSTGPYNENVPISFTNTSTNATDYQWYFSNLGQSSTTHPHFTFALAGNYSVTLIATNSQTGCSDTISKYIEIIPEFFFYLPNSFTPDGDEYNNVFFPKGTTIKSFNMLIFNRWGEIVFETNDFNVGWDGHYKGRLAQNGIYTYKVVLTNLLDEKHRFNGHVQLIR